MNMIAWMLKYKIFLLIFIIFLFGQDLVAQTGGGSLIPLVRNKYLVNVVVSAPLNSELHAAIQSYHFPLLTG
jgi:hypothetical protein